MEDESTVLKFGGVAYYIDLDGVDNMLKTADPDLESKEMEESETETTYINGGIEKTTVKTKKYHKRREVDLARYETYRYLLEIVLTNIEEESDSIMGVELGLKDTPLSFKMAFNTLINYGILKEL